MVEVYIIPAIVLGIRIGQDQVVEAEKSMNIREKTHSETKGHMEWRDTLISRLSKKGAVVLEWIIVSTEACSSKLTEAIKALNFDESLTAHDYLT